MYDAEVVKRLDLAVLEFANGVNQSSAASNFFRYIVVSMFGVALCAWLIVGGRSPLLAIVAGCGLTGIIGGWHDYRSARKWVEEYRSQDEGEVWDCEVTDEGWSYRRRDGTTVMHPWPTIDLHFTNDDGFLVGTGLGQVTVFRKPLADAGLEALFLERINKEPK